MNIPALSPRARFLGILVIGLVTAWIALGARSCRAQQVKAHRMAQADEHHVDAGQHQAKGDTDAQHAQDLNPIIESDTAAVATARAKRDRNRAAIHAGHVPTDPTPGPVPDPAHPQPVVPPVVLAPLDADSDALVATLERKVAHLEMKIQFLESADSEHQAEAKALRAEVTQLRAVIAAQPRERTWAVTGTWGTNQTLGAGVTKDFGRIRVGVDVVRRQLTGGQTTLEALVSGGWRF